MLGKNNRECNLLRKVDLHNPLKYPQFMGVFF